MSWKLTDILTIISCFRLTLWVTYTGTIDDVISTGVNNPIKFIEIKTDNNKVIPLGTFPVSCDSFLSIELDVKRPVIAVIIITVILDAMSRVWLWVWLFHKDTCYLFLRGRCHKWCHNSEFVLITKSQYWNR